MASKHTTKNSLLSNRQFFENYITYKQLSEWIQVSVKTLQDWVYKREIPFIKIGRLVRFKPSEIQIWIEERNKDYGNNPCKN